MFMNLFSNFLLNFIVSSHQKEEKTLTFYLPLLFKEFFVNFVSPGSIQCIKWGIHPPLWLHSNTLWNGPWIHSSPFPCVHQIWVGVGMGQSYPCRLYFPASLDCWLPTGFSPQETLVGNWQEGRRGGRAGVFLPPCLCQAASPVLHGFGSHWTDP